MSASQNSREIAGFVQLAATAAPGHTLAELERVIVEEIARLAAEGPTDDELARGRVHSETQFVLRLQTVGGFGGKSDQLNAYNVLLGDPDYFDRDLARYQEATAASLQGSRGAVSPARPPDHDERRAEGTHRSGYPRFGAGERLVSAPDTAAHVDRSRLPPLRPVPRFAFPAIDKSVLANGLRVWSVRHEGVPLIGFLLIVRRGAADDPPRQDGLAALTADMLDEGTGSWSAIEVHQELARIGAQFDTDIGADATLVGLTALSRFAGRSLELLASVVARPTLADADFVRVRQLRLNRLIQLRDMPGVVADRVFARLLYGDAPYGHTPLGSEQTLSALTVEDVRSFHTRLMRPGASTLIAVGDCDHEAIRRLADAAFGAWIAGGGTCGRQPRHNRPAGPSQRGPASGSAAVRVEDRPRRRRAFLARLSRAALPQTWCSAASTSAGST